MIELKDMSEARRIVAQMEGRIANLDNRILELTQQRDELLKTFADWYDERSDDNECRQIENVRAVIAKVEGRNGQA